MGQKWGNNEVIQIGDIFKCWNGDDCNRTDYYQVVALRGKTQVVLRPIRMETYINEGIEEGSPLYWLYRRRKRPLPGQFISADELIPQVFYQRGREIRNTGEEVTARVLPYQSAEGRPLLQEVCWKWHIAYSLELPEDWEPWDTDMIEKLEQEERTEQETIKEQFTRWAKGEVPWGSL